MFSLDIADELGKMLWHVFHEIAWAFPFSKEDELALQQKYIMLFMLHGLDDKIGMLIFSVLPCSQQHQEYTTFILQLGLVLILIVVNTCV